MTTPLLLLGECLVSALFSLAVLRVLNQPLLGLLERLCPDKQSAVFWRSYTQLMLVLAPQLWVLLFDVFVVSDDPLDRLRYGLIACLGGLLVGLWIVGNRLGRFIDSATPTGIHP